MQLELSLQCSIDSHSNQSNTLCICEEQKFIETDWMRNSWSIALMLHTHTHSHTFTCCDCVLTPFDYWLVLFLLEALFGPRFNANMRGHSNQPLFRLCTQNINTSSSLLLFPPFFVYNSAFALLWSAALNVYFRVSVLFLIFQQKKKIREYAQKSKRWTINDGYGFILHANHARRVRAYHWIELLIASIWYSATVSTSIHSIRIQALASFSFGGSTNKRITLVYSFCTKWLVNQSAEIYIKTNKFSKCLSYCCGDPFRRRRCCLQLLPLSLAPLLLLLQKLQWPNNNGIPFKWFDKYIN